jgi:hypothetical protein
LDRIKSTRYFREQILPKRPYLRADWIGRVLENPEYRETQEGGRVRHWGYVDELGKWLRVVTLEDGVTVHNAFPDRRFRKRRKAE